MNRDIIQGLIAAAVLVFVFFYGAEYFDQKNKVSYIIGENFEEVIFCEKTYRAKPLLINNLNVINTVANIATQSINGVGAGKYICENVNINNAGKSEITWNVHTDKNFELPNTSSKTNDLIILNIYPSNTFIIDQHSKNIYLQEVFDGSILGPIGQIK